MAFVEKVGNQWRGRYRDSAGKRQTAGMSPSKKEAMRLALDEERKIRQGDWTDPQAGKMLFSTYFEEHWLPNRVNELSSISAYRSHYNSELKAEFGQVELRKITSPLVQRWIAKMLKAGTTAESVHAKFRTLSTCLGGRKGVSAVRDGLLTKNPCTGTAMPTLETKKADIYTPPELDLLLTELPAWWKSLLLFAIDSGLRWGELMGIEVGDFEDGYKAVYVQRTIVELTIAETGNGTPFLLKHYPKGKEPRRISLTAEVAKLVETLVRERHLFPRDRLFSMHEDGKPMRTKVWPIGRPVHRAFFRQYVWLPAHERADLRPRHFHDLRGSHISWLLSGGADIATVMERVGHVKMSTTQVYVAAMTDADQQALDALEKLRARYKAHG